MVAGWGFLAREGKGVLGGETGLRNSVVFTWGFGGVVGWFWVSLFFSVSFLYIFFFWDRGKEEGAISLSSNLGKYFHPFTDQRGCSTTNNNNRYSSHYETNAAS